LEEKLDNLEEPVLRLKLPGNLGRVSGIWVKHVPMFAP